MPDAISMLMKDHRAVERLFAQFNKTASMQTAMKICQELRTHTTLEEEIVYPVLARKVDRGMAREAQKEHSEAKQLVQKIERARSGANGQLEALMQKLERAIEHHVEEEETEVFPAMRSKVRDQLTTMGKEMVARKRMLTGAAASTRSGTTRRTTTRSTTRSTARTTTRSGATRRTAPAGRTTRSRSPMLDLTRDELLDRARSAGVTGFSRMNKAELADALSSTRRSRGARSTRR